MNKTTTAFLTILGRFHMNRLETTMFCGRFFIERALALRDSRCMVKMQWDRELVMLEGVLLIALFVSPKNSCMQIPGRPISKCQDLPSHWPPSTVHVTRGRVLFSRIALCEGRPSFKDVTESRRLQCSPG